jgi:hypothetical protein
MDDFTSENISKPSHFRLAWEYIRRYPVFFGIAAFILAAIIAVPFLGSKIIEYAPRSQKYIPQSTLAGIVCQEYDRRPIAIMLATDPEARPLVGISNAEMVFEMPVTPGGVTRIMAVYQCNEPEEIGSIRSARNSFIDIALGLDAIYAHWGGEETAHNRLKGGIMDNLDAFVYEGPVFYRKKGVPSPHDGFTSYEAMHDQSVELGYNLTTEFEGYSHLKGKEQIGEERKVVRTYDAPFNVEWFYNEDVNRYDRFRAGEAEMDKSNGRQVQADVVIVIETTGIATSIDYYEVDMIGSGNATIYQNGEEIKGEWVKESESAPLKFYNQQGDEIQFKPGIIWVEIVT